MALPVQREIQLDNQSTDRLAECSHYVQVYKSIHSDMMIGLHQELRNTVEENQVDQFQSSWGDRQIPVVKDKMFHPTPNH